MANSYESLEKLTDVSMLIAEVEVTAVRGIDKENDSTFYDATIKDVLKDPLSVDEKIVLTQLGIEDEKEKTGELIVDRENPLMAQSDKLILFMKKGNSNQIKELVKQQQSKTQ